jgi:hypothetical protein
MRRLYAAIWIMLATMFAVPALSEGPGDTVKIDRIDVHGPIAWAAGQYTVTIPSKEGGTTQVNGAWLHVSEARGCCLEDSGGELHTSKSAEERVRSNWTGREAQVGL